jgi:hypothetical protein
MSCDGFNFFLLFSFLLLFTGCLQTWCSEDVLRGLRQRFMFLQKMKVAVILLFFSKYMIQFYMRTADITGKVELPESVKMVMPGDNVTATFELIAPVPLETCWLVDS